MWRRPAPVVASRVAVALLLLGWAGLAQGYPDYFIRFHAPSSCQALPSTAQQYGGHPGGPYQEDALTCVPPAPCACPWAWLVVGCLWLGTLRMHDTRRGVATSDSAVQWHL